jgi:hypothetical protein
MTRWLPLLLLACAGCAPEPNPHQWRLEGTDGAVETEAIQAAFDEWCERSEGAYCDTITGNGDSVVRLVPHWKTYTLGECAADYDDDGRYVEVRIRVALDRGAVNWLAQLRWVALHELGHWYRLGFGVHLGKGNVLAPCWDSAAEHLTDEDLTGEMGPIEGCGGS